MTKITENQLTAPDVRGKKPLPEPLYSCSGDKGVELVVR